MLQTKLPKWPLFKKKKDHSNKQLISNDIIEIAAEFWSKHITTLSMSQQLELGCSIFITMCSRHKDIKLMFSKKEKVESASLKCLDMMGWLIRSLQQTNDHKNFHSSLKKLGKFHQKLGIHIEHFDAMLTALHETFGELFKEKYTISHEYAFDEIFTLTAQIMTGEQLNNSPHLREIDDVHHSNENNDDHALDFVKSLDACLKSPIGNKYFACYLRQVFCDEIAIFLENLKKFKTENDDLQKSILLKQIIFNHILPHSKHCLNLSSECRLNVLKNVESVSVFEVNRDFFKECEYEVLGLIRQNHWRRFVKSIKHLQEMVR